MIVTREQLREIRRRKLRTLDLPVVYGEFGEPRPCRVRAGRKLTLRTPTRTMLEHELRSTAQGMPSRKRAVTWLLAHLDELSDYTPRTTTISIISVTRDPARDTHVITFLPGDLETEDRPRLLAAEPGASQADYVDTPTRAMSDEGEAVPAVYQQQLSEDAQEQDSARLDQLIANADGAIEALVPHANQRQRKRLRAARNQIRSLDQDQKAA